jgi:hypothetical protein
MKERFTGIIQSAASVILPGMFKRLVYISSLLAVIDLHPTSDRALAQKLNDIFEMKKDASILSDSMVVKDVIWKKFTHARTFVYNDKLFDLDLLKEGKYNTVEIDAVATHLVETTPSWIRYASDDIMRYDIKKLFRSLPELSKV